ncbi:hypothetical protein PGTUg99_003961 [Puccinia graminis f. sp. tritici]|uniref:Uncharacterized protein n=1 Tax=Puccinia graminis f. sp. tritici TaxID=56615 RepID=A0A5B0M284_PUCGR|nr:hypothetical protein PGTUg99_003961 [Puccinia graminis f. sp. tritici]
MLFARSSDPSPCGSFLRQCWPRGFAVLSTSGLPLLRSSNDATGSPPQNRLQAVLRPRQIGDLISLVTSFISDPHLYLCSQPHAA